MFHRRCVIYQSQSLSCMLATTLVDLLYQPHSSILNGGAAHIIRGIMRIFHCTCENGHISISGLTSDTDVDFLHPD